MKPLTQFEKMRNNRAMLEWHLQQQQQAKTRAEIDKVRAEEFANYWKTLPASYKFWSAELGGDPPQ